MKTLLILFLLMGVAVAGQPVSGYFFMSKETQEMQDDEFENPGLLAVEAGSALFHEIRDDEIDACSSCHGEQGEKLNPKKIASYPRYDSNTGELVTLQEQINHCWEIKLDRFPLDYDSKDSVMLETFVRNLARGEVINVQTNDEVDKLLKQGEVLFNTRFGQLDMACYHCHVQHQGQMLRGQKLTEGHANGFPEYRLGSGNITSLHKRLRECFISFRAEPFDQGSEEFKLLELYLMFRGNGLQVETPAIRY